MKPIFSVITVHFNQLPLLKSTVDNIMQQVGFGELIEYIIVDGLSNDGTLNYLHELKFEKSIHRIIGRDAGIYDAMNKGILAASGEYVVFINAGDQFYETDTLAKIYDGQKSFDVIYGDTEINYPDFSRIAKTKSLDNFWRSLPFVHQSVIVKRSLLTENLFDLNYKFCADYNQLSKLYSDKIEFVKYDSVISCITAGGTSDVQRIKSTKEVFTIAKKRFKLNLSQRFYFRMTLLKARLSSFAKKVLPKKSVEQITRRKYK